MASASVNDGKFRLELFEAVMQELAKELGRRIRERRKAIELSQEALALACQLDRSYMGRIERGEMNVTVEKLYRIAQQLGCHPRTLLP
ncbi:anaerobic benzoate catabolism transcriptional regulator [compost metagenome]